MIAPLAGNFPCGKIGARMGPFRAGPVREKGEAEMADIEMVAVSAAEPADAEGCFARGMIYSAGAGVAVDLIEAHKWFNIAAMRGHGDAARLRREIAEQMSDAEIGCAQRAARGWLKAHPQDPATPAVAAAA
jgi:TPR repeat protein